MNSLTITSILKIFFFVFQCCWLSEALSIPPPTTSDFIDNQDLPGYPARNTIAPINSTWTNLFLNGLTISGAPRAEGLPPIFGNSIQNCGTNANVWAITYDDGPGPVEKPLLDDLASKKIKATFFSMGSNLIRFPASAKRIVTDGHEICMHSWSHRWSTNITNDQLVAELVWNAKAIYQISGKVPRYFRPPFGDVDERVRSILKAMDIVPILWNLDTLDYNLNTGATTEARVLATVDGWIKQVNPNGLLTLQHDLFNLTAALGPSIHAKVISSKYSPVTVSQCVSSFNVGSPYATSGKLYQLVTGYPNSSVNPFSDLGTGAKTNPITPALNSALSLRGIADKTFLIWMVHGFFVFLMTLIY